MRLRAFAAAAIAFWLLTPVDARAGAADANADPSLYDRLARSAFFSDACRQRAAEITLSDPTDLDAALSAVAAFRGRQAPAASDARDDACEMPAILLVNLLRWHRVDAELVLVSPSGQQIDDDAAAPNRIYVYVPKYDRYLDPETLTGKQAALDQSFREQMRRVHLQGPSIAGVSRHTCANVCMLVLGPLGPTPPRRVTTETIRRP